MSRRYTPVAGDTVVIAQLLTEERWDADTCTLERVRTTLHIRATVVYVRRRGDYQVETGSGRRYWVEADGHLRWPGGCRVVPALLPARRAA